MGKQCGNYMKGCMWELYDGEVCGNHIMGKYLCWEPYNGEAMW
jgi:hypothetical protein